METFDNGYAGYSHWNDTRPSPTQSQSRWAGRGGPTTGDPPSPIERPVRIRESRLSQVDHSGRPQSWLDEVGNNPSAHRRASAASPTTTTTTTTTTTSSSSSTHGRLVAQILQAELPRGYPGLSSTHTLKPQTQTPFSGFNLALPSPEISKDLFLDAAPLSHHQHRYHPPQQQGEASDNIGMIQSQPGLPSRSRHSLPNTHLSDDVFATVDESWPSMTTTTVPASDTSYLSPFSRDPIFAGGMSPTSTRRDSKVSASDVESNSSFHAFAAISDVQYAVVEFKIWRSEIYTFRKSVLELVRGGAPVIVEADRGEDLGIVVGIFVNRRDAEDYKILKLRKNYQTLISYSKQPFPDDESLENSFREYYKFNSTSPQASGDPKRGTQKAILRLANSSEIALLRNKEGLEERAKRTCAQKIKEFKYPMEVVDAELQIDHKKLTYYTLSDEYVNFSPMVTELFKIFKFRIWISVLNPSAVNVPQTTSKFFGGLTPQGNTSGKHTVTGAAEMYPHHLYEHNSRLISGSAPLGSMAAPRIPSGLVHSAGNYYPPGLGMQDSDRYFSTSTASVQSVPATSTSWNARYFHPTAKEHEQKLRSPGTPHSAISSGSTRGSSGKSIDYDELMMSNFGSLNLK